MPKKRQRVGGGAVDQKKKRQAKKAQKKHVTKVILRVPATRGERLSPPCDAFGYDHRKCYVWWRGWRCTPECESNCATSRATRPCSPKGLRIDVANSVDDAPGFESHWCHLPVFLPFFLPFVPFFLDHPAPTLPADPKSSPSQRASLQGTSRCRKACALG